MIITPETEKGIKFEIWLELLLKQLGYQNVLRNVHYQKRRHVFRQADITYNVVKKGNIYLALVEAKYSSNGPIHYQLRRVQERKNGQLIPRIDNLVDEVVERQAFVGADFSVLATNSEFEEKVKDEARKRGILCIERGGLTGYFAKTGDYGSIEDSIRSIDIRNHNLDKNLIYI